MAERRRLARGDRRRLVDVREPDLELRHAADGSLLDVRVRRRARHGGTLRADYNGAPIRAPSDDRSVLQHRAFTIPDAGTFGNSLAQRDHRARLAPVEREVHARRALGATAAVAST